MARSPRILLIAGSAERHSCVRASLDILADIFSELGAQPQLWDLTEQTLPLFLADQQTPFLRDEMPSVRDFLQIADQAEAFVLGSPIYHNSFSGILKNALDMLSPRHFYHKPVALVSNGSNDRTASLPCEHLRSVVKGLSTVAIPTQMVTFSTDFLTIGNQRMLANSSLLERFKHLARELLYFTSILHEVPQTDLKQEHLA